MGRPNFSMSIFRTKFVHVLDSGEEKVAGTGLRIMVHSPDSHPHMKHQDFELVDRDGELAKLSTPAEVVGYVKKHGTEEVAEWMAGAERWLDGVEVNGNFCSWDMIAEQGYEATPAGPKF